MNKDQKYWLVLWSVVVLGFVAVVVSITIGLHYAHINATEQMRVCSEAGMSFVSLDGDGTCMK